MKETVKFRRSSVGARTVTVTLTDGELSAAVTQRATYSTRQAVNEARTLAHEALASIRREP